LVAGPGIGWHYETGIQIIRMILAGVFDRFPNLTIVIGHWGEVVLFYLERADMLSGAAKLPRTISEYFRQHVYVTPRALFSHRYLPWAMEVLGAGHILFATDYPFAHTAPGSARNFLSNAQLSETDRNRIASENWDQLCSKVVR